MQYVCINIEKSVIMAFPELFLPILIFAGLIFAGFNFRAIYPVFREICENIGLHSNTDKKSESWKIQEIPTKNGRKFNKKCNENPTNV